MIKLTKYELRQLTDTHYFTGLGGGLFVGLIINLLPEQNKLGYWVSALVAFILLILLIRRSRRKLLENDK